MKLFGLHAEGGGQAVAYPVGDLGADIEGHLAIGTRDGDTTVRFHGCTGEALGDDPFRYHHIGAFERVGRILHIHFGQSRLETDVGVLTLPDDVSPVCDCGLSVGVGGKGVIVDDDLLGCVGRLNCGFGHDCCHDVADETDPTYGKRWPVHGGVYRLEAIDGCQLHVLGGVNGQHARHGLGGAGVDRLDDRSDEDDLGRPQIQIVEVLVGPRQQAWILLATN